MNKWHVLKDKRIVQIGCGAVGNCMLPLYKRHLKFKKGDILVFDMKAETLSEPSTDYPDIVFIHEKITRDNLDEIFSQILRPGDCLLDLAWYIDTLTLLKWCHTHGVNFVNTAVETWMEDTCDLFDKECQTLYSRQLVIRKEVSTWEREDAPTAIITHGANPGWVSHAVKIGLRDWVHSLAQRYPKDQNVALALQYAQDKTWNKVAQALDVQVIHIAERDTQISNIPKQTGEFVNTWSPQGFIEEAIAPAELGWGTHETLEEGVHHYTTGPKNQVYLDTMGMNTRVQSWVPSGDIVGMVVRHEEAFSISEHLTVYNKQGQAVYRPTVHYAYFSCSDSIASLYEMSANGYEMLPNERVLKDEIISGEDELGVFMLSKQYGGWWTGSLLNKEEADALIPHQSATVIQVAAGVLSSILYAFDHPKLGVIHPDHMDPDEAMKYILPYLGRWVSFEKQGWKPRITNRDAQSNPNWIFQKLQLKN